MEFKLLSDSATQESFSIRFATPIEIGKWDKISRKIKKLTFNQSDPTTLKQIQPLPIIQVAFHLFNNTIPN
jgi:hypothetical protein